MQTGAMLNIVSQNPMTVSMRTIDGGGPAEATADSIVIDLDDTASVTLSDVRIDASELFLPALWVYDGALNLELAGEGSLESGGNIAGLQNDGNPLTISGDGSLEAEGGGVGGAGIGGGYDGAGSNITIMGGTIRATVPARTSPSAAASSTRRARAAPRRSAAALAKPPAPLSPSPAAASPTARKILRTSPT